MGWFSRKGSREAAPNATDRGRAAATATLDDDVPLSPTVQAVGEAEEARITTALEELASAGVDVDDLASLGAGLDAAFAAWQAAPEGTAESHDVIINRFAMGIGEHLHRHTDLRWQVVTDAFGTDLAVADGMRGDFVVVPSNLVAVRWLRREQGWVPAVVGHLVARRTRR